MKSPQALDLTCLHTRRRYDGLVETMLPTAHRLPWKFPEDSLRPKDVPYNVAVRSEEDLRDSVLHNKPPGTERLNRGPRHSLAVKAWLCHCHSV